MNMNKRANLETGKMTGPCTTDTNLSDDPILGFFNAQTTKHNQYCNLSSLRYPILCRRLIREDNNDIQGEESSE
jgi:hypothetical protein